MNIFNKNLGWFFFLLKKRKRSSQQFIFNSPNLSGRLLNINFHQGMHYKKKKKKKDQVISQCIQIPKCSLNNLAKLFLLI